MDSHPDETNCLVQLKKLIKDSEDEHFKNVVSELSDDKFLLLFIRCKKYDVQAALDSAKKFANMLKKYPDTLIKFHPETLRTVTLLEGKGALKQRDAMGCHVLVIRLKSWDPKSHSVEELILSLMLIGKELIKNKETQINGINIIANIEGITFSQARQFSPFVIKRFVDMIVNSTPLKFKGLHLTHVHPLINVPLSMLKCILPEKLKKRVHSHSRNETLHKFVDPAILPDWLGGDLTENAAFDKSVIDNLYSPQVIEWYTKVGQLARKEIKK